MVRSWDLGGGCSVISHADKSSSSSDPIVGIIPTWKSEEQDEVSRVTRGVQGSSSLTSLVKRTVVALTWRWLVLLCDLIWLEPNDWEVNQDNLWILVLDLLLAEVPFGSLHE